MGRSLEGRNDDDASEFATLVRHATALRHELHRHPEKTWQEEGTAARVRAELARLGFSPRVCAGTGTYVDLGPEGRGRVALRADIDALPLTEATGCAYASENPGVMHACGHDGHTASLLATAAWLKRHEPVLKVPVRLLFQPAEEGGHGAKKMIEDGCLEGVEEIYGYHNLPTMPWGKFASPPGAVMVSNGYFRARIIGSGGHASTPEACCDPLLTGAQFVALAQQIVSRNVAPQKAAVVTVSTFHCGTARNVIADEAVLEGTIRAAETELRDRLAVRLNEVLQGVCAAAGARPDFFFQPAYQATINHAHQAEKMRNILSAQLGQGAEQVEGIPFMGGEDFSYYLKEVPGAYVLMGSGIGEGSPPLHSPRFDFNDELIPLMVSVWSRLLDVPLPPKGERSAVARTAEVSA